MKNNEKNTMLSPGKKTENDSEIQLEVQPENDSEVQPENKSKNSLCKICCDCVTIIIVIAICTGGLTCYFMFLSPREIEKANECKNSISDILTKVNVTSCDGRYVDCKYTVNNRNITCRVEYNEPKTCIFPDNSVYIYTSKNNKYCTSYKDKTSNGDCNSPMIGFFILSILFLGGYCLAITGAIIYETIKKYI